MKSFFKKHKIVTVLSALVLLVLFYCAFVMTKAYFFDTPDVISRIGASNALTLKLENVPERFLNILLAVEDPNFYSHNGIDVSTPGAGWTTITQGIVKIYFFEKFKPGFLRIGKLDQSLIALAFNKRVDKQMQLLIFINSVYLGGYDGKDIVGFQEGAREYFNKDFYMLNEDEFIALTAMIVGPNEYNIAKQPAKNAERVKRIKRFLSGECKPESLSDVYYNRCE